MSSNIRLFPRLNHPASRAWQEPALRASQLVYPIFVTCEEQDKDIAGFSPNKQWGHGLGGNGSAPTSASPINFDNIDFFTRNQQEQEDSNTAQNTTTGASPDEARDDAVYTGMYSTLVQHLSELMEKGLRSVMIFGVVPSKNKDHTGTAGDDSWRNPVVLVCRVLRRRLPDLQLMVDVCLCEYTDHGHCGSLDTSPTTATEAAQPNIIKFNLPETLERLASCAEQYAKAGAHWVCPSDMMDGRVAAIRSRLDSIGHSSVGILAYTSKKASSSLYAPFRVAVDSTFKGNRKQYQQPVGSRSVANAAWNRDTTEGCDAVLVKPSLFYTDIIRQFADLRDTPSASPNNSCPMIAAYVVSGEYKMLYDYGTATGTMEEVVEEAHLSLLRAGTDILITYFTPFIINNLLTK